MIYKAGILGASGKVGLELCHLLASGFSLDGDFFELADVVAESKDLESIEGVSLRTLSDPEREPVHGWIDFSSPSATLALLKKISAPLVIGTTGFEADQRKQIEAYASKHPVILSSNMSPGMNWLFSLLRKNSLPLTTKEISLSEIHHRQKKDAPSGTAKTLLQLIKEKTPIKPVVTSVRASQIIGVHEITFFTEEEEITITHRVNQRQVFATGAILALQYLLRLNKPGLYSMEDLYHGESV